jgi:uncharacterized protein (TIGR02145 family)
MNFITNPITNIMKRLSLIAISLLVSVAMLLTACKKDDPKPDNGNNNNNQETPGGGDEGGGGAVTDYVDLGLPSGTQWKSTNETGDENGFYTYDEAVITFGDKLPTKEQLEELKDNCTWEWQNNVGYKVTGTNGNSIVLPASGYSDCDGDVHGVGYSGFYWSSTAYDSESAWDLYSFSYEVTMNYNSRCFGFSVRLVQK